MATETKNKEFATVDQLHAPPLPAIDVDAHQKDMERRAAERDERCSLEERLRLCNPKYAAEVEAKKPVYRWKVEFQIIERKTSTPQADKYADNVDDLDDANFKFRSITKHADAIDEKTAWAKCCDQMQSWPSPKIAKPKFTKLKQIKL